MPDLRLPTTSLIIGLTVLLIGVGINSSAVHRTIAAEQSDSKLKSLLNEKLTILKEFEAQLERVYKLGQGGYEELFDVKQAMHRAELDLCDSDDQRVKVLNKMLEEARERETLFRQSPETASSRKIHRAQVERLDVEIAIERIKSK